ncbi:Squalene/phytoene synthase [Fragilaria crotonensis]|nr:Squalene/phytoene synthase [Fragilaria crotonensis]
MRGIILVRRVATSTQRNATQRNAQHPTDRLRKKKFGDDFSRLTMGRKKRNSSALASDSISGDVVPSIESKKPKAEEKYLVKKYRPEKHYEAMDAFLKYTKSHRMLDASYVRTFKGTTPEKPFIFSVRVAGTDLAWGRGSTREKAMDCACRGFPPGYPLTGLPPPPFGAPPPPPNVIPPPPPPQKKTIKGGLTLVFDSGEDGPNELCMEERRASLDRYQKLLRKALVGA